MEADVRDQQKIGLGRRKEAKTAEAVRNMFGNIYSPEGFVNGAFPMRTMEQQIGDFLRTPPKPIDFQAWVAQQEQTRAAQTSPGALEHMLSMRRQTPVTLSNQIRDYVASQPGLPEDYKKQLEEHANKFEQNYNAAFATTGEEFKGTKTGWSQFGGNIVSMVDALRNPNLHKDVTTKYGDMLWQQIQGATAASEAQGFGPITTKEQGQSMLWRTFIENLNKLGTDLIDTLRSGKELPDKVKQAFDETARSLGMDKVKPTDIPEGMSLE